MAHRTSARHTGRRTARLLGRVAVVLVVLAAVAAPPGPSGTALGLECAAAQGTRDLVRVGLVIDRGDLGGGVSVQCVTVASGATGFDVLRAADHGFRLNSSGLLCAIDGAPASGCGDRTPTGYRYWSYFHGDAGRWRYASIGPASRRVRDGDVEGWRFTEGSGTPSDPPPAGPADPAVICPPLPPPSSAVPPPTAPTTTPAPPAGVDADPTGSPATVGPTVTVGGADPSVPPTPAPGGDGAVAATAVPADRAGEAPATAADPDTTTAPSEAAAPVAPAPAASSGGSGGQGLVPVLVVVALLLGVGGAAAFRLRREDTP